MNKYIVYYEEKHIVSLFRIVYASNEEMAISKLYDYLRKHELCYDIWLSTIEIELLDEVEVIKWVE